MSDSETDPEDSNVNYIPYSQRPEWSDIEPLKQNDGPYSVVRIAYTEKFSETFDYIRACMQKDEMSQRALELTKDACQLNPANYTVWCYRRKLLFHLNSDLNEELIFIGQLIREHQKNYQVNVR
ncbi:unnamed protein product [Didymodactylos carnosus]|uniref:Protein farnesyltransferase/geranylgeranyltransferase type-1 subunit alpha n=1 Tax=Didymodactylos carnosus TaxID=1234261 RepID=A0A8S2S7Q8_9BILA|nr:unnamed protein product [Didymodactylos carnosus]CAF4208070.1 unnamed protein product [Didymodactylos carnosus]